ncbi:MAG: DUF4159 domain-containing protein [Verrucomicrobiota bacterium]
MKPGPRLIAIPLLCASVLFAQRFREGGGSRRWYRDDAAVRTARDAEAGSMETPMWTNLASMPKDVFTFVRVRFDQDPYRETRSGGWRTDFPDSDLNLSWRLQQMTSIKVDPNGRVLKLTDPELADFPFVYMAEPGALLLEDEEVRALRKYLLNGGFLMADDFWGPVQWVNFERQIKRVFPEYRFFDIPMEHPIFHCVFDLGKSKNALQTPNFMTGERSKETGVTWEYHNGEQCEEVHIRGISDERNRLMILACHNTDNGDGWEREGEYEYFFHEFSEKRAYPFGVNVIYYVMTH